jgi:cell division septum initiation protein DivIVA
MSNRPEAASEVMRLLENLKQAALRPRRVPILGITFGYDPDAMSMGIDKIRASLPKELKDAATIAKEGERILESARDEAAALVDSSRTQADRLLAESRAEAERILEQAQIQAERLVADSEVLKIAKAQADEIRAYAERESLQLRRGADRYAHDALAKLEATVARILSEVERGKSTLDTTPAAEAVDRRECATVA